MTQRHVFERNTTEVTVIGLGPMGSALAETLLERGHSLTVWNRTAGKDVHLIAEGARSAATVAEAVAASPVTIVCLNDYPTVRKVLDSAGDALKGAALVNLTSGTPEEARAAAARAAEEGIDYLDGAIMVPPPLVGQEDAVFLFSGAREVLDRHRRILASLGDPRFPGSDPGLAVLLNTALLGMMYTTLNGFLHAAALARSAHVPVSEFAELALGWFMPAVLSPDGLAEQVPSMEAGVYPGELGTMEMNLNALEHIARTSVEQGVHTELPRLMRELVERAISQGHGHENYFAMFEVFGRSTPETRGAGDR